MEKQKWNDKQKKIAGDFKSEYLRISSELSKLPDKTLSNARQKPLFELRKKFIKDMKDAGDD